MSSETSIDLLLLGKTGNGKSATGNSILKRKIFKSCASSTSVTKIVTYGVCEYKGTKIKVVDGPGVGDTDLGNAAAMEQVAAAMQNAIDINVNGYHAFLIVVRYGTRFDEVDKHAFKMLKEFFGNDFLKHYGIVIFTNGDNFENDANGDNEGFPKTFDEWVKEQKGELHDLVKECKGRYIVFNNRLTGNDADKQIDELLATLDSLKFQGHRYCGKHFEEAQAERQKAMITAKLPEIQEETLTKTDLILEKLDQILNNADSREDKIQKLQELKTRANELSESIREQDKGTGALRMLETRAEKIKQTVETEVYACKALKEEEERHIEEEKKYEEFKTEILKQQSELMRQLEQERENSGAMVSQLEQQTAQAQENKKQAKTSQETMAALMRKMAELEIERKEARKEADDRLQRIEKMQSDHKAEIKGLKNEHTQEKQQWEQSVADQSKEKQSSCNIL